MALVATISTFPTEVAPGEQVDVLLTIVNTGSSAVSLRSVEPVTTVAGATRTQSVAMGRPPVIQGVASTSTVPASPGTLRLRWSASFHAPQPSWAGVTTTYSVGASIVDTAGAITEAQAALVEVVPRNTGQPEPTVPQTAPDMPSQPDDPEPVLPGIGQARFDYYQNAALAAGVL